MNENTEQQGRSDLVLPIICPHCKKELNLGMMFELLPPEELIVPGPIVTKTEPIEVINDEPEEE